MNNLLNIVVQLPTLMNPFMPDASKKLSEFFNENIEATVWEPRYLNTHRLIKPVDILFNKLDIETVLFNKDS
jgi:methionyl-tRNA synthetase